MNNRITLPIKTFETTDEILANSNFHKVKILIMHTGENLNGSVFSENSIDCSLNTLSNIPILGYVERHEDNKDFAGHETDFDIFTDEDGKIKVKEYYKEQPIGVIPETNEYFKETIDDEIYLGCYGYIWKCYSNDAYDILVEDEEKEVSMEILVKECSYDKKNRCNINKFEFLGVTVLGAKVPGAMGGDCVLSMNFSAQEFQEYCDSVDKLNKLLKGKEDVSDMEESQVKDTPTVENFEQQDEEVCPECGKNPCKCDKEEESCKKEKHSVEESSEEEFTNEDNKGEDKSKENVEEPTKEEDNKEEESCKKEKCSVENSDSKEDFALSLNNIFRSIRKHLEQYTYEYTSFWGDVYTNNKYYTEDLIPENNIVVLYDCEENEYYGVPYSFNNDEVVCDMDNKMVYIHEWRKREEGSVIFQLEKEPVLYNVEICNNMAKELKELKEYKANILAKEELDKITQDVDAIISNFEFSEEETQSLREKAINKEIDLETLEDKLFALEGRKLRAEKQKFSAHKDVPNNLNIVDISQEEEKSIDIEKEKIQSILDKYGD